MLVLLRQSLESSLLFRLLIRAPQLLHATAEVIKTILVDLHGCIRGAVLTLVETATSAISMFVTSLCDLRYKQIEIKVQQNNSPQLTLAYQYYIYYTSISTTN